MILQLVTIGFGPCCCVLISKSLQRVNERDTNLTLDCAQKVDETLRDRQVSCSIITITITAVTLSCQQC
jgi:hypothetical protein